MLRSYHLAVLAMIPVLIAAGCDRLDVGARAEEPNSHSSKRDTADSKEFHAQLLEIAAGYKKFGRFEGHLRVSPEQCRAPRPSISRSDDAETHGKKLYYLLAKDPESYLEGKEQKPGQVIVKESWKAQLAKSVPGADVVRDPDDKKHYERADRSDLYVMLKLDPKTPNTDEGWVYGTVTADGKRVTSAGRVESCMNCHQSKETTDRMFGLSKPEEKGAKR
jgi:hypothetical protein